MQAVPAGQVCTAVKAGFPSPRQYDTDVTWRNAGIYKRCHNCGTVLHFDPWGTLCRRCIKPRPIVKQEVKLEFDESKDVNEWKDETGCRSLAIKRKSMCSGEVQNTGKVSQRFVPIKARAKAQPVYYLVYKGITMSVAPTMTVGDFIHLVAKQAPPGQFHENELDELQLRRSFYDEARVSDARIFNHSSYMIKNIPCGSTVHITEPDLPRDWEKHWSSEYGLIYWWNAKDNYSMWTHPTEPALPAGWEKHWSAKYELSYWWNAMEDYSLWTPP